MSLLVATWHTSSTLKPLEQDLHILRNLPATRPTETPLLRDYLCHFRHTRPGLHHVQNLPASFACDFILANLIPTPVSLMHLMQALPHYTAEDIVHIHECTLHPTPGCRYLFNTSSGPSHCNVIVTANGVSLDSLLALAPQISWFISGINPSLMAKSSHLGYGGLPVSTTQVPTFPELSQVETFV